MPRNVSDAERDATLRRRCSTPGITVEEYGFRGAVCLRFASFGAGLFRSRQTVSVCLLGCGAGPPGPHSPAPMEQAGYLRTKPPRGQGGGELRPLVVPVDFCPKSGMLPVRRVQRCSGRLVPPDLIPLLNQLGGSTVGDLGEAQC